MYKISPSSILEQGREVLKKEAATLESAAVRLDSSFQKAVELIASTTGKVVCSGLGKSGHVARKIAATLSSTGTPASFLHPAEALHGDLGMITRNDCLLAIAYGGETTEILEVCKFSKRRNIPMIGITGKLSSTLAEMVDIVLDGSVEVEACPHNLAPTNSSTLAMALGDALAVALMGVRGFSQADFAAYHPAGSLGRKLATVSDLMRSRNELKSLTILDSFSNILEGITNPNFGIVPVLDDQSRIVGAITDGDLRRALSKFNEQALSKTAGQLMTPNPKLIRPDALAIEAFGIMEKYKITSLFVTSDADPSSPLVGIIRMHDLLEQKII